MFHCAPSAKTPPADRKADQRVQGGLSVRGHRAQANGPCHGGRPFHSLQCSRASSRFTSRRLAPPAFFTRRACHLSWDGSVRRAYVHGLATDPAPLWSRRAMKGTCRSKRERISRVRQNCRPAQTLKAKPGKEQRKSHAAFANSASGQFPQTRKRRRRTILSKSAKPEIGGNRRHSAGRPRAGTAGRIPRASRSRYGCNYRGKAAAEHSSAPNPTLSDHR